jgi:hypothetical protein
MARRPGSGVRGMLQGISGSARRMQGQRPGDYAVRITCGTDTATLPFSVIDLRGPRDALGSVPGASGGFFDQDDEGATRSDDGERDR